MYADSIGDEKAGLDEVYESAVSTSNLRVGNDSTIRTPGDMIAAAGMNRHRMGLALTRLASEWAGMGKPALPTAADIETLARTYKVEPASEFGPPNPNAGKVELFRNGKYEYVLPLRLAKRERAQWYEHEATLVVMNLRSLPWVRDGLLSAGLSAGWECDAHVVCSVLLWWLHPQCPTCGGRQAQVVAGTGRTNGRICKPCRGTGLADPPHGRTGERLAGYIRLCRASAKGELSEGIYRLRRTMAGESKRGTPLPKLRTKQRAKE